MAPIRFAGKCFVVPRWARPCAGAQYGAMRLANNLVRIGPPRPSIHGLPSIEPEDDEIFMIGRCKVEYGVRELSAHNLKTTKRQVAAMIRQVPDHLPEAVQVALALRIAGRANMENIQLCAPHP